MKESSTYQAILAEGRTEGRTEGRIEALKKTLLRQGGQRFRSPPDESMQAGLQAITDESRLERMTERLLTVSSWQDLMQTP
jgi:predicted transposase YdaD